MIEEIAKRDAHRSGVYRFQLGSALEHSRLCGHGEEFNTEVAEGTEDTEKTERKQ
jgi:hypothetical protein